MIHIVRSAVGIKRAATRGTGKRSIIARLELLALVCHVRRLEHDDPTRVIASRQVCTGRVKLDGGDEVLCAMRGGAEGLSGVPRATGPR